MHCAVQFLGSSVTVNSKIVQGRGRKATWTFEPSNSTLVLRFGKSSPLAASRVVYSEEHLRQLYLYVECNYSHTALKEELEPGCDCCNLLLLSVSVSVSVCFCSSVHVRPQLPKVFLWEPDAVFCFPDELLRVYVAL